MKKVFQKTGAESTEVFPRLKLICLHSIVSGHSGGDIIESMKKKLIMPTHPWFDMKKFDNAELPRMSGNFKTGRLEHN